MIHVIGGTLRGRRLPVGPGIRPTTGLARKAAFDILGPEVKGARVLDAAAGSGAYGVEALSRGARGAVFVESDRRTASRLRESIERLGLASRAQVVEATVARFASGRGLLPEPFELVFFDPPWDAASLDDLGALGSLLSPGATLVHERGDDEVPPLNGLQPPDVRRYGRTRLLLYRRATG